MEKLFNLLLSKNLTISFAESMTGGYLSHEMTKYPNASKVLIGSIISYNKEIKTSILKVKEETINKYSIVSSNVSIEMLNGLKNLINSDIYVSVTGNAGPSFEINTNKLECFISINYNNQTLTINHTFESNVRLENIKNVSEIVEENLISLILNK